MKKVTKVTEHGVSYKAANGLRLWIETEWEQGSITMIPPPFIRFFDGDGEVVFTYQGDVER